MAITRKPHCLSHPLSQTACPRPQTACPRLQTACLKRQTTCPKLQTTCPKPQPKCSSTVSAKAVKFEGSITVWAGERKLCLIMYDLTKPGDAVVTV